MPGPLIAVTPPPLCQNLRFRETLEESFPGALFNPKGRYLTEPELKEWAGEADGLLVGRDAITDRVLEGLPRLKIVAKYGVGLDTLDLAAMEKRKIVLGWTGGVNRRSVAELTLGFMLGLFHNMYRTGFALKSGQWNKDGGRVLSGKTVGIVGCGHIGKEVVQLLQPFGCRVLVRDILDMTEFCRDAGVQQVGLKEIFMASDVVSLHVPLTDLTRRMIDHEALAQMKRDGFLINTSRGEVVDPQALKDALLKGTLGGAALDVFWQEPPDDLELLASPRLMVTPHIGGNTAEAVEAMGHSALDHLKQFFRV